MELVFENIPFFLKGAYYTLYVTVISMFFAFFIGVLVAIARLKGPMWLRLIARFYVSIMRGTPLLVQLFVIYYGLVDYGVTLGSLTAACLAISLNAGAFLSETFRGAIQAVPKGQSEAAYATGMSRSQTMWRIVFPQAVRIAIPPMGNTFIGMLKETSLVAAIGVTELLRSAQLLVSQYYVNMPFYLAIGVIYWVMSIGFSAILEQVERRLARAY